MLWNLRCWARFASGNTRTQTSGQDFDREAFHRRQRRLVGAIIGSSVGLIGSSYCLYMKLKKAKTESLHPSIDSRNSLSSENNSEENEKESDEETDGRKKKGKHGFRERRVRKRLNGTFFFQTTPMEGGFCHIYIGAVGIFTQRS